MATKSENNGLEEAHLRHFADYIPGWNNLDTFTIEYLINKGFLQVSTIYEHALGDLGGHDVVSKDSHDLSDGSDAKLSSVRTMSNGKCYSAPVTNIKGKTGILRVQAYERKQNKFYYFAIPRYAYAHVPVKSNIEIPFELNGTPRKVPSRKVKQNWWEFEVPDFTALATKTYINDTE